MAERSPSHIAVASLLAPAGMTLFLLGTAGPGHLPFLDDFEDGDLLGWTIRDDTAAQSGPSDWVVVSGELVQRSNIWSFAPVDLETRYHLGTHAVTGEAGWDDYTLNAVLHSSDNDGIGLIARYQNSRNYYRVLLMNDPAWSGRDSAGVAVNKPIQRIQKFVDGEPYILAESKVSAAYPAGYFALTLEVRGDTLRAYLDGELILQARDDTFDRGMVGLMSYANTGSHFDDVSVTRERIVYDAPSRTVEYPVRETRAPYIQRPTGTSVDIAWRSTSEEIGRVVYGARKGMLDSEVVEDAPATKHHVTLTGLDPGERYYYEVYSGDEKVAAETDVRAAPPDDAGRFSFLLVGDSGTGSEAQWEIAGRMRSAMNQREIDFIVHAGDVHQGSGDYYDDIYFKPYRDIIKNVNVFTALGNHDVVTDHGGVYLDDFYLPEDPLSGSERYYSFRWANAYFICLDTNIDYSPGSPQYDFLLAALSSSRRRSATWTFVYAHHPPYSEFWTDYYGEPDVREHLVPVFEEHGVDVVMNGHTHSYERGTLNDVHYVVSGGGGGALDAYFVDYPHVSFSAGAHHFVRFDIEDDELVATAIGSDGSTIDRFAIAKTISAGRGVDFHGSPSAVTLEQSFPNPMRTTTAIRYAVPDAVHVRLVVYDGRGRRIGTLVDAPHAPGLHAVTFDGSGLASGNYMYRLDAGGATLARPFTVIR